MQQNRAEIRLDYIRNNAEVFMNLVPQQKFCAVVKADAYGHGAVAVCQSLARTADMFAVSLVEEGVQLRHAGIESDVLVLTPALKADEIVRGGILGLIFTVGDIRDYVLLAKIAEEYNIVVRCHIKIDTGMNRYGFSEKSFYYFLAKKFSDRVHIEGIYSHFYKPDDFAVTQRQFCLFRKICEKAEYVFGALLKHISATGGVLASRDFSLDMVRVGIGLYGYLPSGFHCDCPVKPAMRMYADVVSSHSPVIGGAGYGDYPCPEQKISIIRAGYADGFFRQGNLQNINNLCMDAHLTLQRLKKYQTICIFSDADEYAQKNQTISYEVLVMLGRRAEKFYVEG